MITGLGDQVGKVQFAADSVEVGTGGTPHQKSTAIELISAAANLHGANGLWVSVMSWGFNSLVSILAGNTLLVSDLFSVNTGAGVNSTMFLPVQVAPGVAINAQAQSGTAWQTMKVGLQLVKGGFIPTGFSSCQTLGYTPASSELGTIVTPGGSGVEGALQSIGTVVRNCKAILPCFYPSDGAIIPNLYFGTTKVISTTHVRNYFGNAAYLYRGPYYLDIPAGTELFVSGIGDGTAGQVMYAGAYCFS